MNSKIMLDEIKRLYRENKKKIYTIAGIVLVLTLVSFTFLNFFQKDDTETIISQGQVESNPGIFRVYVEQEDGTIYINSMIIEEYFLLPEVIKEAEKQTGVDITSVLEKEKEEEFVKTQYDRGAMGLSRNGSTHIFTFVVNVGTEKENLKVANFYFDYLFSNQIDMLENKEVYVVSEPEIFDEDSFAATDLTSEGIKTKPSVLSIISKYIITIIGGAVLGISLGFFYVIVQSLFNKKINYAFTYAVSDSDHVALVSEDHTNVLIRLLSEPSTMPKVIVSEETLPLPIQKEIEKINRVNRVIEEENNILVLNNVDNVDPKMPLNDVFIFIASGHTSKSWYKKNFRDLHLYNAHITIVQYIQ